VQAAINMSVNLQLIQAKGMTLPFISYGGSSMVSLAYGVGMMLALTRHRPRTEVESVSAAKAAAHGYA
jgi:cell division protein FtsW